jgi:hypothetical protein
MTLLILAAKPAMVLAEVIPDQFVFGASAVTIHGPLPGGIYTKQLLLTSATGDVAVDFYSSGYRDSLGFRENFMTNANNMLTGWCSTLCFSDGMEYRGWVAFGVPPGGPYTSAALRIAEWWVGTYPGNTETVAFYDVLTPGPMLFSTAPNTSFFDDFGTGLLYGTQELPAFRPGPDDWRSPVFTIPLNDTALAAINNSRGDYFAMGARLVTFDVPAPEPNALPAIAAALAIAIGLRRRFAGQTLP